MEEQILVVRKEDLFNEDTYFEGFKSVEDFKFPVNYDNVLVERRGDMEEDPTYKQLISYVLVRDKQTKEVFFYSRLSGGGESRLFDKTSIGVGGHMNWSQQQADTFPGEFSKQMVDNALREIHEELTIVHGFDNKESFVTIRPIGYLNDDNDEVNKVHIGIVYLADISSKQFVEVAEKKILSEGNNWKTLDALRNETGLEDWSKFLVNSDYVYDEVVRDVNHVRERINAEKEEF